jgi:hypothetical protein
MNNIYYVPILSKNLAHYFRKGCICPVKYLNNRGEDLQNRFSDYILCSKSEFTSETNCALEVVLTSNEKITSISDNFQLLEQPLPISRVKRVIFTKNSQSKITLFNINEGAAFLPNHLVEVVKEESVIDCIELENIKVPEKTIDWNSKLIFFDKILGGVALMKFATANFKYEAFNYFGALSLINTFIRDELKNQGINYDVKPFEWLILDKEEKKLSDIKELIFSQITNDDVTEIANKRNVVLEKSYGTFSLDKITNHTVQLLAILASYGDNTRMNLDTFFSDFSQRKFKRDVKGLQGIALAFGINKGYEVFRNYYKTQNFIATIKFKLDNQLDYYTIESVYQYTFNEKTGNLNFDYLDNWCFKQKNKSVQGYETYDILDQTIILTERIPDLPEVYENYLLTVQRKYHQIPVRLFREIGALLFEEAKKTLKPKILLTEQKNPNSDRDKALIELCKLTILDLRKEAEKVGLDKKMVSTKTKSDIIPKILDAQQNKLL